MLVLITAPDQLSVGVAGLLGYMAKCADRQSSKGKCGGDAGTALWLIMGLAYLDLFCIGPSKIISGDL